MIWAACSLCFFGFLRSGEITVPSGNGYDPGAHVSFTDVAIDDRSNSNLMRIRIKASKTDPFRKGDDIYHISAMLAYLAIRGEGPGPLFRLVPVRYRPNAASGGWSYGRGLVHCREKGAHPL